MKRTLAGLFLCGALGATALHAQPVADSAWPTRPVRMLHGFISGGAVDITARLVAAGMTEHLGQQVIVDGRPGAGGTVGAAIVARAEADGYTLFLMASGHVAGNPFVLAASPRFPAKSVNDLVRIAKAEPGKINYGTGGVGTGMHLASLLFQNRAGIQMNHIPYKGGNAAPVALLAGEIPLIFNTPSGVETHVRSGRMRVLAVTTRNRSVLWPDVPTIAETVLPGFDVSGWYAVAAPKGLPAARVKRLNHVVRESLKRPDVGGKLTELGAEVTPTSPEEAQRYLASEVARWVKLIRDAKIPPQD
jgi:tripartite-type tricarboxylate transporter receptor subunit TctC